MIAQPAEPDTRFSPVSLSVVEGAPEQAPARPAVDGEALFRQLVQDHRQRLYRFIVKHIGWGTDAEDLTQQAFVEAAQSYASFKGASELSTWLYADNPAGRIQVEAQMTPGAIQVTLRDEAPAFNPLLVPEPNIALGIEEREIGGLGLLFVRRCADELDYQRLQVPGAPASNQICFSKRLA